MKLTTRILLISCLIFWMLSPLFGLDVGGALDNTTELKRTNTTKWTQRDRLSLWLEADMGEHVSFSIHGNSLFSIDEPNFLFDLDYLILEGQFPHFIGEQSLFAFKFGRFRVSDFTRNVLDHNADGIDLALSLPSVSISASIGTTMLLFEHSSNIIMSKGDYLDSESDDQLLAPSRLVGTVGITFPELLLGQTLNLAFLYQFDLRQSQDLVPEGATSLSAEGGSVTSQYSGIGLSGTIAPSLYYDSFFYLGTGSMLSYVGGSYNYELMLSYLFGAGVRLYMEEALYSKIELRFLFASGDEDYTSDFYEGNTSGTAGTFVPISSPTLALVFSPALGNIFLFDLSYSIKPFSKSGSLAMENFQTMLKGLMFFRASTGLLSEPFTNRASEALYLGTEIDVILNFRPFSDLGMALSYGIFIPNSGPDGAFFEDVREIEMLGRFELSISF